MPPNRPFQALACPSLGATEFKLRPFQLQRPLLRWLHYSNEGVQGRAQGRSRAQSPMVSQIALF